MAWLDFVDAGTSPSGKTRRWNVQPKAGDFPIGTIAWHGPWRRYVLEAELSVFDAACLREIADFCEAKTTERRMAKA